MNEQIKRERITIDLWFELERICDVVTIVYCILSIVCNGG